MKRIILITGIGVATGGTRTSVTIHRDNACWKICPCDRVYKILNQ